MSGSCSFLFVPLRLVEPKTEFIITGSEDGYFNKNKEIPSFDPWPSDDDETDSELVARGSLAETMLGLSVGSDLSVLKMKFLPRLIIGVKLIIVFGGIFTEMKIFLLKVSTESLKLGFLMMIIGCNSMAVL